MKILIFLIIGTLLAACVPSYSNKASFTQAERDRLLPSAEAGNADAQYQLGNSWCCGPSGRFYSTDEAKKWWCKAANQGHVAAREALETKAGNACIAKE